MSRPTGILGTLAALWLAAAPLAAQDGGPFSGPNPWPAIRRERIRTLLPTAMQRTDVDAWVTLLRENANDPLALHLGGENAGAPSAVLVFRTGDAVRTVMLSGFGEAIALRELGLHDSVVVYDAGAGLMAAVAERLVASRARRIAVNSSGTLGIADGLTATQRRALEAALPPAIRARLVSSDALVSQWLAIKLPAEVAIMRRAAALTVQLETEAYATVIPGTTRDHDLATFLKRRMRQLGVEDGWSPAQNPSVNSGPDRGHSHASDRVIQPGDIIQTDFGIKVHGVWVTDIQRFAYVLRPGETAPPPEVQRKWEAGRDGGRAAFDAMRPGVPGSAVDSAQRLRMAQAGSATVPWGTGHPVGYWAHDVGPGLNRRSRGLLAEGMTFAFDGFHAWTLPGGDGTWGNGSKTISVEEMAVITATGAEYLVPPQQELILIRGAAPPPPATFFLTSRGPGDGANLGGLAGADRHCASLAQAAGLATTRWAAYLSAAATDSTPAVHARDRIGTGPWTNTRGTLIARNVDDLHSELATLTKAASLTETGEPVNGRGDQPNRHDILTGSTRDGRLMTGADDTTCRNWTSNADTGSARVGHHDRTGGGEHPTSWNSAHASRGCGQANLRATGGDGLFYCFGFN